MQRSFGGYNPPWQSRVGAIHGVMVKQRDEPRLVRRVGSRRAGTRAEPAETPVSRAKRAKNLQLVRELQPKLIAHFLAVADNEGISRAAEELHLTQPALSKSLKQLEDRLGVPLFERHPTGVRLTPYGQILARRGRIIERELSHAVAELHTLKGGASGSIRIGGGLLWSQLYLPPVIAEFQRIHEGVTVELRSGVIDTLVPALIGGDLDIICTTLDFPESPEVVKELLVRVCHAVYARAGHPLASRKNLTAADVHRCGWVALKNDYVGTSRLGAFFAANGLGPPNVRIELTADVTLLELLATSDLLGSLPIAMENTARARGVVPILVGDADLWASQAGVAYRKTSYPTPIFWRCCEMPSVDKGARVS
jgi:DNA-binding transcriptional LysR family regulator